MAEKAATGNPGLLRTLPGQAQEQMNQVFDWFNSNVQRLEGAYQEIGLKFDKISHELHETNEKLVDSVLEIDRVKTQLNSVLQSLDSSVILVDNQGTIHLFNQGAERIYGVPEKTALGRSYAELFQAHAKSGFPLLETLQHKKEFSSQEKLWEIHGVVLPIGYTTNVVRDPQGTVLGAVEISSDLTEMKRMQNQMQHAKTLAALGEMAATVAHEIRNPLGGIGGFAGLLERDLDKGDPRRELVGKIVQGVSSLNKIVSNLLVFTRPMQLQLQRLDFRIWLEDILRYAELEAAKEEKKIRIVRKFPEECPEVTLDPEKFQQVMINLVFNAIQSVGDEGLIEISVALDSREYLIVSVWDNGSGIDERIMEKLFNPFFTTRETGTGLGLAIVRRIVELHGGTIAVDSERGKFARFSIRLNPSGVSHG